MTKVTIDRELLERVAQYTPTLERQEDRARAISELRSILESAPRQPEGDGLKVVGWYHSHAEVATSDKVRVVQWLPECIEPLCRLSDAQRAIAELREECERLRVKLMTIASAEPGRHNIEWAKAMAATGNNEAYAKWREAFDQRDKMAGLLREAIPDVKFCVNEGYEDSAELMTRIDAALGEVEKAR